MTGENQISLKNLKVIVLLVPTLDPSASTIGATLVCKQNGQHVFSCNNPSYYENNSNYYLASCATIVLPLLYTMLVEHLVMYIV